METSKEPHRVPEFPARHKSTTSRNTPFLERRALFIPWIVSDPARRMRELPDHGSSFTLPVKVSEA